MTHIKTSHPKISLVLAWPGDICLMISCCGLSQFTVDTGPPAQAQAGQKVTTDLLQVINPVPAPHLIWQFAPWFPVWQPGGQLRRGSAEHYVWPREEGAGVTSVFKAQRITVNISRAGTMHARDTRLDWRDLKPNSKPRATLSRLMVVICSPMPQLLANRCL